MQQDRLAPSPNNAAFKLTSSVDLAFNTSAPLINNAGELHMLLPKRHMACVDRNKSGFGK